MRESQTYTRRKRDEDVRVLATFPLRARAHGRSAEEFRVIAKRYGGNDVLDLRTYYQNGAGEWHPTQRGTLLPRAAAAFLYASLADALPALADPASFV